MARGASRRLLDSSGSVPEFALAARKHRGFS
jgi:hypothetical protein